MWIVVWSRRAVPVIQALRTPIELWKHHLCSWLDDLTSDLQILSFYPRWWISEMFSRFTLSLLFQPTTVASSSSWSFTNSPSCPVGQEHTCFWVQNPGGAAESWRSEPQSLLSQDYPSCLGMADVGTCLCLPLLSSLLWDVNSTSKRLEGQDAVRETTGGSCGVVKSLWKTSKNVEKRCFKSMSKHCFKQCFYTVFMSLHRWSLLLVVQISRAQEFHQVLGDFLGFPKQEGQPHCGWRPRP